MPKARPPLVGFMRLSLPVLLLSFLIAGCATSENQADVSVAAPPPVEAPKVQEKQVEAQAPPAPVEETRVAEPEAPPSPPPPPPLPPPPPPPVVQLPEPLDLYFDYDRYALKLSEADKVTLGEIAELLKKNAERVAAIEGHCDERGTSAYNLALGERRAKAAKQYLESQGVPPAQIQTTSFGKERPVCTDHNKTCWQKNRRAHVQAQ